MYRAQGDEPLYYTSPQPPQRQYRSQHTPPSHSRAQRQPAYGYMDEADEPLSADYEHDWVRSPQRHPPPQQQQQQQQHRPTPPSSYRSKPSRGASPFARTPTQDTATRGTPSGSSGAYRRRDPDYGPGPGPASAGRSSVGSASATRRRHMTPDALRGPVDYYTEYDSQQQQQQQQQQRTRRSAGRHSSSSRGRTPTQALSSRSTPYYTPQSVSVSGASSRRVTPRTGARAGGPSPYSYQDSRQRQQLQRSAPRHSRAFSNDAETETVLRRRIFDQYEHATNEQLGRALLKGGIHEEAAASVIRVREQKYWAVLIVGVLLVFLFALGQELLAASDDVPPPV